MNKTINKIIASSMIVFLAAGCSSNNDTKSIVTMAKESVSVQEAYDLNREQSVGQALAKIINNNVLNKEYGYKNNEEVKDLVDVEVKSIKTNNPTIVKDYDGKNALELLEKSGQVLSIMEKEYVKDTFVKNNVTEDSLKKLYDNYEGEKIKYYEIKLTPADFSYDNAKYEEAIKDVEKKLKDTNSKNAKTAFESIIKSYPGAKETPNGLKDNVERTAVHQVVLTKLDTMKNDEFTKEGLDVDGSKYYILKIDNPKRESFDASKERLTDLQFEKATTENSYLSEYMLYELREKQEIEFASKEDEEEYKLYNKAIIKGYEDAVEKAKTQDEGGSK